MEKKNKQKTCFFYEIRFKTKKKRWCFKRANPDSEVSIEYKCVKTFLVLIYNRLQGM